ncbi:MAG: response regulator transcription factor [Betaproteobacteria bacterium]|nr:MAG: response regulator transcription factor [Betaproteobacteria bacterium]
MRILVVDDHPLIVRALAESLPHVDSRFDVIAAANREQTLTALARYPDCALVLLDLTLPGARGLDLLAELRLDYPLRQAHVDMSPKRRARMHCSTPFRRFLPARAV